MIASILLAATSQAPVLSALESALSESSPDHRSVSPRSFAMLMQASFTSALIPFPTSLSSDAASAKALTLASISSVATACPPAWNSSQPLAAPWISFFRPQLLSIGTAATPMMQGQIELVCNRMARSSSSQMHSNDGGRHDGNTQPIELLHVLRTLPVAWFRSTKSSPRIVRRDWTSNQPSLNCNNRNCNNRTRKQTLAVRLRVAPLRS